MKIKNKHYVIWGIICIIIFVLTTHFFFRIDLTSDKRYSISAQTKKLMKNINEPLHVTIYLDGDLNSGFYRLKRSISELIEELAVYSHSNIKISFINPSANSNPDEREKKYVELSEKGMTPTAVYERDKEGNSIQKIIFPWIELNYKDKTIPLNLLKNISGNSGEENLNISIENLEFEITDAIRQLVNRQVLKIAFIEGHDELSELETYDISKSLSKYFQIDRGVLGSDASVLKDYKVIIIAKPIKPFTEQEKYIIDQYIMNGGRVLWLIDGVRLSVEELSRTGFSPALELDLNLNDLLFTYGVRINPVLLQDVQCITIPMNISSAHADPQFEAMPLLYSPLLLTSGEHPITKNVPQVRADFSSDIEVVGDNSKMNAYLLLATSDNSHIISTPATINLSDVQKSTNKAYFNTGYVPVAISLEGIFNSNFANRMPPKGLVNILSKRKESLKTRQIFIADGDIIRNEILNQSSDSTTALPLGLDRYSNIQYGNKEFIQHAVLYLADNEGWMQLRSRTLKLRLLNKQIVNSETTKWVLINTVLPILILFVFGILFQLSRKRRYTK